VQRTGIGPALRKARLLRGKSIEEASRETRIRAEYLQALERERFDALLGEVYVRGCLRSYSTYLGLDPGKLLSIYTREFGAPGPSLPNQPPGPPKDATPHPLHQRHSGRHLSWSFLIGVALLILAMLGAVGLLSRSKSAPPPQTLPSSQASIPILPPTVTLVVQAASPVIAVIQIDGGSPERFELRRGEGRSFEGSSSIDIRLDHGGSTAIIVNGHAIGRPGQAAAPYSAVFSPTDFRRSLSDSSPSPLVPSGSAGRTSCPYCASLWSPSWSS